MKSLAGRTVLGFTQIVVFLGAALFIPGWKPNFWQGWLYLSIFAAASALITAYLWKYDRTLLESRVKADPRAEKEKSQKLIQLLASLAFIGTLALPSLDCRYHWSHLPSVFRDRGRCCYSIRIPCRFHRLEGEYFHLSDD